MQEYIKKSSSGSGNCSSRNDKTLLILSSHEMKDIIKTGKSLEDSSLPPKGVSETIQIEVKEQKGGKILAGKGINGAGERHGQGIVRTGYGYNSRSKKTKFSFPSSSIDRYSNKKVPSKWI